MVTFLLWNVNKQNRDALVQGIVRRHRVDVVLLVEYAPSRSGSNLSTLLLADGILKRGTAERFGVFGRQSIGMNAVTVERRTEVWDMTAGTALGGRFALVHGLDRIHNDDGTRRVFFRRLAKRIRSLEGGSHRRSIIVGDFNAHPFDSSVASSDGLHAVGIRSFKSATNRRIRLGTSNEDFFYNPMWRKYGDAPDREAGLATYYWQNNLAGELFWHMLDQVVIRPEECARFPERRLKILTQVGGVELLAPDGTPDRGVGSDHLPLLFEWNI